MDATVTNIQEKSDAELKKLWEAGVRHLYLGIESGLDDVLKFMKKDHDLAQAYQAIDRLHEAGLIYDAHIMTGVAGKGRGMENAEALAQFLNRTNPAHVVNFSMFLHKEVPLYQDIRQGTFVPADELETIREEYHLIEIMACRRGCIMGGGQPTRSGDRTKALRAKGLYNADNTTIIKKSDENPLVLELYNGLLKGKEHHLLHNDSY